MSDFDLKLRSGHDVDAYRAQYARDGYVRIMDLFAPELAEAVHQVLVQNTPYKIVHSDKDGGHVTHDAQTFSRMDPQARGKIMSDLLTRARDGFAYFYAGFPMVDAYLAGEHKSWPLHRLTEFLNTAEMHNFVKTITDEPSVRKLDAQATLYSRGHFLNEHDDSGTHMERRAAYVMGFTKDWRADWGGALLFTDGDRVKHGFAPSFNTLTLFKTPQPHVVTQVSNFAGLGRYSVTGWLRND